MPEETQVIAMASAAVFDLLSSAADVPMHALQGDTRLAELGLDSLKLVEIIFDLESRFQVTADENMLLEVRTVADLIALISPAVAGERS
jgi:acyl carrier protein